MRPAVIVIVLTAVLASSSGQAQPRIARESLPASVRPEVARQIDELFAPDAVRRANGACELSRLRDGVAAAIPFLVSLLGDDVPTPMVRCRLLRQMGAWARDFEGRDLDLSAWPPTSPAREAARALERYGIGALDAVLAATIARDFTVRKYGAWILAGIDDDRAVSGLMRLLRDGHPRVRAAAAQGLGRQEDRAAVYPLMGELWDKDAEVRAAAAWALGRLEDRTAVESLVQALGDPEPTVRSEVAWALGRVEDRRAVASLGALLTLPDPDARARSHAAWALGRIEDAAAVSALSRGLRDPDERVRRQAVWALGRIESAAARGALIEAVDGADLDLRRLAISALAGAVDPNPNPNPRAEIP
jgi:HEAT repeat protein